METKQIEILGLKEEIRKAYESDNLEAAREILLAAWCQVRGEWKKLASETRAELLTLFQEFDSKIFSPIVVPYRHVSLVVDDKGKYSIQFSPGRVFGANGKIDVIGPR